MAETTTITTERYTYKDTNRDWWRLMLSRGRSHSAPGDPDASDYFWAFALEKQDDATGRYRPIWSGEMLGMYDDPPTVERVMKQFAAEAAFLAIGFSTSEAIRKSR